MWKTKELDLSQVFALKYGTSTSLVGKKPFVNQMLWTVSSNELTGSLRPYYPLELKTSHSGLSVFLFHYISPQMLAFCSFGLWCESGHCKSMQLWQLPPICESLLKEGKCCFPHLFRWACPHLVIQGPASLFTNALDSHLKGSELLSVVILYGGKNLFFLVNENKAQWYDKH